MESNGSSDLRNGQRARCQCPLNDQPIRYMPIDLAPQAAGGSSEKLVRINSIPSGLAQDDLEIIVMISLQ